MASQAYTTTMMTDRADTWVIGTDSQMVRVSVYAGLAILDVLTVVAGFSLSDLIRNGGVQDMRSISYWLIVPTFLAVSFYVRAYSYNTLISRPISIWKAASAMLAATAITVMLLFALKNSGDVSRLTFFTGTLFCIVGLTLLRLPLPRLIEQLGSRFFRQILITEGDCSEVLPIGYECIDVTKLGIRPDPADPLMLNRFSKIVAGADRVTVSCAVENRERWSLYLKSVDCDGELLIPELHNIEPLGNSGRIGLAGVRVSLGRMDLRNRLLKRGFDLAIAATALVVLLPIMLIVAVAIKLESPGPVLFRQQRMGRANRLFEVLKFRSMYVDQNDHAGDRSTARGDGRITRVGRIIRITSLDELPQLLNVVNGEMSLVGPRPHALGSKAGDNLFWHVDRRYWLRHTIKPGVTGLAQVRGYRGTTDNEEDLLKRLASDMEYAAHWSIVNDAAILLRTLLVLFHRNAY